MSGDTSIIRKLHAWWRQNILLSKQVETLSKSLFQSERELLQYDANFYTMCETVL